MSLETGARLGPYEVVGPLGAGGMGEVYRARDTRLDREVAIKVLPADVASDASRLKRFEKEARAASSLNHPNIVTIYDLGQTAGVSWIAMERVEGKTLRELLASGALPVKRALAIGAQIADGLSKAHEAGIVHRDLKPENVMVTKDGLVKILDFGLAKLGTVGSGSGEVSQLPTETGTSPGVVLGTVGYMSPEQASGHAVDFRSDQFAFGSILYEMATGRRAFSKKTAVDTLSAILNEEPEPIVVSSPQTPAPLRWLVERCLAKEPRQRYSSTDDLAREIATLRDHLSEALTSGAALAIARSPARLRLGWALALAALLATLAAVFFLGKSTGERPLPSFRRLTFRRGVVANAKFAPDGRTILYTAAWDGDPQRIYSTRVDGTGSIALQIPNAMLFSISASSELAISLNGTLAQVPMVGGGPRELLEDVDSAAWSPDGSRLAVARRTAGRVRLEYPIGKVLYETAGRVAQLCVSPRGDRVVFFDHPIAWDGRGSVAVVDTLGKKRLLTGEWSDLESIAWGPGDDEVWFTGFNTREGKPGEIHAVSLSGKHRVVASTPGPMGLEDVARDGRALATRYTARDGIIGVPPGETAERELSWLDSSHARDLSADGKTLLFYESSEGSASGNYDAYIRKTDGSPAVRIGEGEPRALSPDGKWALSVVGTSPPQLFMLPTGAGEKRLIERGSIVRYATVNWQPDGARIWFTGWEEGKGPRVYLQDVAGGTPRPVTAEGTNMAFAVAPDGRILVRVRQSGTWGLVSPEGGEPTPVAGIEDREAPIRFSADGRALFLQHWAGKSARIYRLDLASGRRDLFREIRPPDPAGLETLGEARITPDGRSYVYGYTRALSDLYLVEGLR